MLSRYITSGAELEDAVKSAAAAVKNSFITEKVRMYSLIFVTYHNIKHETEHHLFFSDFFDFI